MKVRLEMTMHTCPMFLNVNEDVVFVNQAIYSQERIPLYSDGVEVSSRNAIAMRNKSDHNASIQVSANTLHT